MSTSIRPELSPKNSYWIEKHRYYELKHFCLQYPLWKSHYNALIAYSGDFPLRIPSTKKYEVCDPITKHMDERLYYANRMGMLERVAKRTDAELAGYILKAITEGISYDHMRAKFDIPCCKDTYYVLYRRFFWLLSEERQ